MNRKRSELGSEKSIVQKDKFDRGKVDTAHKDARRVSISRWGLTFSDYWHGGREKRRGRREGENTVKGLKSNRMGTLTRGGATAHLKSRSKIKKQKEIHGGTSESSREYIRKGKTGAF